LESCIIILESTLEDYSIALFKIGNVYTDVFNIARNICAKDGWEFLDEDAILLYLPVYGV